MSKKGNPMRDLPTPSVLARLKPNAKGGLYLEGQHIVHRFAARCGKHQVVNEGEQSLWNTEEEALAAAKRFRDACRAASA